MTKTFYDIMGNKTYKELTNDEKIAYNDRVDHLASEFAAGSTDAFAELYDALRDYIGGLAYRYSQRSFSIEQEDFEGIINLVLVESLTKYDSSKGVPFQPFFAMNIRNEIKMVYRTKGRDVHDETLATNKLRLDAPYDSENSDTNWKNATFATHNDTEEGFYRVLADELISGCFGEDDLKRTVILMYLDGFKLRDIANAVNGDGKKFQTVEKFVQRTVKGFKEYAISLT